jgi:hypothetical protein
MEWNGRNGVKGAARLGAPKYAAAESSYHDRCMINDSVGIAHRRLATRRKLYTEPLQQRALTWLSTYKSMEITGGTPLNGEQGAG